MHVASRLFSMYLLSYFWLRWVFIADAQMLETRGAPGKVRREGPAPPKSAQDCVQPAHAATETPQSSSLGGRHEVKLHAADGMSEES